MFVKSILVRNSYRFICVYAVLLLDTVNFKSQAEIMLHLCVGKNFASFIVLRNELVLRLAHLRSTNAV